MTVAALQSGMYLVGREDGTVEPVLVRLRVVKARVAHTLEGHPAAVRMAVYALAQSGWWWRRMIVPGRLPLDLNGPPPVTWWPED